MGAILGLLLSFSLLSSPGVKTTLENQASLGQIERVATDETTFTVQNTTQINIGVVNVKAADGSNVQIPVTGPGEFNGSISASAVACNINGQPLTQGVRTPIVINQNTTVNGTWTGNIIVIDQDAD
jgi:hypothetical protein